ncbi:D-aminoacyl-tRNA deacylase [bioreactor metagenome]|uniref:D-aminoacyl-tRNA deacylase n=1 Tax=bioreactor metagenome TaxID=1076179 RepID=A0A644YM02_9ZZZZ
MTLYFDTHAHYDDNAFSKDRDEILSSLPKKGVSLTVCPASDMASAQVCVRLADAYPYVYAAVGVHPHDAERVPAGWLAGLEALSYHPKVVAVGEIGLDYYYDRSPREVQQDVFRSQMALALKRCLPVIVHDREAHRDCLNVVRAYPGVTGVYHCYSGSLEDAKTLVNLGWMLSFTGAVTFKNARRALEVIGWLPMERIMIETDSPYLTPEPFRGRRNDSTYVYRVAEVIAQVKDLPVDEVARITMENGKRFFHIDQNVET